jgi:hypothetical protein
MTDPLWSSYVDAVRSLGALPELRDERRRQATAEEEASVRRARERIEEELRRCEEWSTLARRAVGTAEARLVAAQVLVPDPAAAPPPPTGSPAELAALVERAQHEVEGDVAGLDAARRRSIQNAAARERRASELAARRKQLLMFAGVGAAVVLVIILIAVLAG